MVRPAVPPYRRFLRGVHRRVVAVRIAEAAGVGLLAGSGVAIVMAGLLLWIGRPAVGTVGAMMIGGALMGGVWGFVRRPGVMASAVTADSQLGLADLLSTALAVERESEAQPWVAVVLSSANARSAEIAPSAIVLRRLNARVWGAMVLAAMLAVTLAAFSGGAANGFSGGGDAAHPSLTFSENLPPMPDYAASASHVAAPQPHRRTWSDPDEQGHLTRSMTTPDGAQSADRSPQRVDAQQRPGITDDTGSGTASSGAAGKSQPPPAHPVASPAVRSPRDSSAAATAAGGAGPASQIPGETRERSSLSTGSSSAALPSTAPWSSSSWPADVTAARQALDAGRVPAGYREIVRDYFDKP